MTPFRRAVPVAIAVAALACSDDGEIASPIACTEEFRSWTVTVVDDGGVPVAGLEVDVTRQATGALLPYGGPGSEAGSYRIMDDGMREELASDGESVVVEGAGTGISFRADYRFGTDGSRCHVEKISGPDTVAVGG